MTDQFKATRDEIVAKFAAHAATLFAADATRRSAMLVVAQYWNDQADDEVHAHVIASTRATPVWPHECDHDDTYEKSVPLLAGEACWWCGGDAVDMDLYGGYGDAVVNAIELFCREGAHQNMSEQEAYLPFAIARRGDADEVDLEIVGQAQRPPAATIGSARATTDWPDARARALFDEVCRHADDDGPRTVLSDYLLETHPDDLRGEAIALALGRDLDAASRARRDELFREHADRWMFPIGDVIVPGCAHFERGFLARAEIFADSESDRDRVLNAPAWGTLHTVRFAPGSRDLVAPTMLALRSVGPLRDEGAQQIARARRPWRIEHIRIADGAHAPLLDATNLPRLAHLELPVGFRDRVEGLRRAPWWPQLVRLGFHDADDHGSLADWRALRVRLGVRELAIVTDGWQLGFRADDTVAVQWGAWRAGTTLAHLVVLANELAEPVQLELVSTRERGFAAEDVTWLRDRTGRDIRLRAVDC